MEEKKTTQIVETTETRFSQAIKQEKYVNLINDTLGDKETAKKFIADISSVVGNNYQLKKCTTNSIITGGLLAQSLNLPLAQSLGFAYLVPYKSDGYMVAQFQVGWKGLVQLCLRTNQYECIGVRPVHKGEWVGQDEFGEDVFKFNHKYDNEEVIGYFAYFKLLSGFKKTLYWTKEQCEAHGTKYSQAHRGKNKGGEFDNWSTQFEAMSMKTVLKQLISKYGIMTTDINKVIEADQAVIEDGKYRYVDNEKNADIVSEIDLENETKVEDETFDQIINKLDSGE